MAESDKAKATVGRVRFRKQMLTRPYCIDASATGWGILKGDFRPAIPREAREYFEATAEARKGKPEELIAAQAKFYAEHLKSWNWFEEGPNGEETPVPITPENVAGVPLPIWDLLEQTVFGYTAPIVGNSAGS